MHIGFGKFFAPGYVVDNGMNEKYSVQRVEWGGEMGRCGSKSTYRLPVRGK